MSEKILEVKHLQVSFKTQAGLVKAVRDISFDLNKGETLAIVGESGSGKSVTSKSIIGILAGNAVVEGGEILYDGQDLLKISEEDFHKIRGDKIAMIFQDPMSSLNPIMKIGNQLTEAMILKTKTSKKNARDSFNNTLELLVKNVNEINHQDKENEEAAHIFDSFCVQSNELERIYNEAMAQLIGLQVSLSDLIFLLKHQQKINVKSEIAVILSGIQKSIHPYVLIENEEVKAIEQKLSAINPSKTAITDEEFLIILNDLLKIVDETSKKAKPDYFTLGYYVYKNPNADYSHYSIDELDKMTKEYVDNNFLLKFISLGASGLLRSHQKSIDRKRALLDKLDNASTYFSQEIEVKKSHVIADELISSDLEAIDHLEFHKNSVEYTFPAALSTALNVYFNGTKQNVVEMRKFQRQESKYNRLVKAGKTPDWKVVPPSITNLDLAKSNIVHLITTLKASFEKTIENDKYFDSQVKMVELIDFFKDQASRFVAQMTPKMAKAKAIKLLEEVGIQEPNIRYNQYPFEFSGGMRQRIVIAIALSANPDILICDEPTTALDVTIQSQILELINNLKKERNLSVIFITHNLGVVANMADRIAVMYAGKIVEYGTSDEIFYDSRHPYTWALLSCMPDLETKEKLEAIPGTPPNMIYPPKGDAFAERNKYALKIDFEEQPPLFKISDTHYAATWLLDPRAPKVEVPQVIKRRADKMKEAKKNAGQ